MQRIRDIIVKLNNSKKLNSLNIEYGYHLFMDTIFLQNNSSFIVFNF